MSIQNPPKMGNTLFLMHREELINIINGLDASSHHTIQIEGKAFKAL